MALARAFSVLVHTAAVHAAKYSAASEGAGAGAAAGAAAAESRASSADGPSEFDSDDGLNEGLSLWRVPRGFRIRKLLSRDADGIADLLEEGDNELEVRSNSVQLGKKQIFGNQFLNEYGLRRLERCKPRPPPLGDTVVVRNLGPNVTERDLKRAAYPGVSVTSVDFWDPNRFGGDGDDFLRHLLSPGQVPDNRSADLRFFSDGDAEIGEANLRKTFGKHDVERLPKPEPFFMDDTLTVEALPRDGLCWRDIGGARLSECRVSDAIEDMTLFLCLRRHERDKMVAFLADLTSGESAVSKLADFERAQAFTVFRVPEWSKVGPEARTPLERKLRSGNARLRVDRYWRKAMLRTVIPNSRGSPPETKTFVLEKLPHCEAGLEVQARHVRRLVERTPKDADLSLEVERRGTIFSRTKDILCWRSSALQSCFLGVARSERRLFCCNTDPATEAPTEVLLADDDGVRIAGLVADEFQSVGNMLFSQCEGARVEGHGEAPVDFLHTNLTGVRPTSLRQFCWRKARPAEGLHATSCWRGHDPAFVSLLPYSVSLLHRGSLVFCLFEGDDPRLDRIKVFVPKDYANRTAAPNSWRRLTRVEELGSFMRQSGSIGVELPDPHLGWASGWREEPGTFDRTWSSWLVTKLLPP